MVGRLHFGMRHVSMDAQGYCPQKIELCKRQKWMVAQALHENEWINKLSSEATISIEHLTQFVHLWALIQNVHLRMDDDDDI
jgi:hypothetical protein